MGAIANWTDYLYARDHAANQFVFHKICSPHLGQISSSRSNGAFAGVTPSTAAVPTKMMAGAIGNIDSWQNSGGSYQNWLLGGDFETQVRPSLCVLVDRLSHQGGLSGIVTGAQTTNLPTAALTRYTDGAGVWAVIEIYTQVGGTITTITVDYTNQDGNPATSLARSFGSSNFREARRILPISLAQGDTGVRAVSSVNVLATTGTAGNFGITLVKPLCAFVTIPSDVVIADPFVRGNMVGVSEVLDDACIELWELPGTPTTAAFSGNLIIAEA